jgi:hypothetical protein
MISALVKRHPSGYEPILLIILLHLAGYSRMCQKATIILNVADDWPVHGDSVPPATVRKRSASPSRPRMETLNPE